MKTIYVRYGACEYPVVIGMGLAGRLVTWLKHAKLGPRLVLVSHPELMHLHGQSLIEVLSKQGFDVVVLEVPSGEAHKTLEEAGFLYCGLNRNFAERNTPVLAMGGGVIGDLAGFVAATYLRGVPLIHLPTTLLAQVDSSLGGKTAVNCGPLKNQIGAFYPPRAVFSDTQTLASLPPREVCSGLSEMLKTAVIKGPRLFTLMEKNMEKLKALEERPIEDAVYLAAGVKAWVVSRDEREQGLRQVLNLGHTVGHALEAVTEFQVNHGEAVAIGMVAAGKIANRMRLFSNRDLARLSRVIGLAGLPLALPDVDLLAIMEAMKYDKKAIRGKLRFVLPVRIGQVIVREVEPALVAEVLSER